jgi:phage terminase large subunit
MFHKIIMDARVSKQWKQIHISAFDSPMITGEKFQSIDIPDLSHPEIYNHKYTNPKDLNFQLATEPWAKGIEVNEGGKDSVIYITKVLGEICDKGYNNIVPLSDVLTMFENSYNKDFDSSGQYEIGIDVARMGEDKTVMYKRKGMKVIGRQEYTKQRAPFIADRVIEFVHTLIREGDGTEHSIDKEIRIKIDDGGLGGGVTDILMDKGYNVVPINFGGVAINQDKYPNTISEMWLETPPLIPKISAPENERLKTELVNRKTATKFLDNKGRRCIESKDEYKKRGFNSPDDADAFLLCFYSGARELGIR